MKKINSRSIFIGVAFLLLFAVFSAGCMTLTEESVEYELQSFYGGISEGGSGYIYVYFEDNNVIYEIKSDDIVVTKVGTFTRDGNIINIVITKGKENDKWYDYNDHMKFELIQDNAGKLYLYDYVIILRSV